MLYEVGSLFGMLTRRTVKGPLAPAAIMSVYIWRDEIQGGWVSGKTVT